MMKGRIKDQSGYDFRMLDCFISRLFWNMDGANSCESNMRK